MEQSPPRIAYLDCPTGIAGDMCLGALLDAGLPLSVLEMQLAQLGLTEEYQLEVKTVHRQSQAATEVSVQLQPHPPHHSHHGRHLPEIEALIRSTGLSARVIDWSLAIFRRLADAEAAVHGVTPDQVHFHEVGATDALVDIVGTCIGLDWLGVTQLYCSALPVGGGMVKAAHGRLPVPAPAVLRLLAQKQVPIYSNGIERELVTPTGGAIATTLATGFGAPPPMTLTAIGQGAGHRDLPIANILRLWLGHGSAPAHTHHHVSQTKSAAAAAHHSPVPRDSAGEPADEAVIELQTQVDDMTPQAVGYLYERLFAVGALDVFAHSVGMKKNRPGLLLTVICRPQQSRQCRRVLFQETPTLGIRSTQQQRQYLYREQVPVDTPYGNIQIKIARVRPGGAILNLHPEYEDCARCAREQGVPWKQVYQGAITQAVNQLG
ncbi:MAG: nickel pincer cofactor biosynthesis protein LarC [Cyanobacteria bacterium J06626_23]